MSRLTKYKPTPNSMFPYKLIDDGVDTDLDAIHKLGQIEDIEEELGIDLITLFKAIKQGYIYKKLGDGSITKVDIDMLNFEEGFKGAIFSKTYAEGNYKQCYKMDTYTNSKTWALTKEELEDKK